MAPAADSPGSPDISSPPAQGSPAPQSSQQRSDAPGGPMLAAVRRAALLAGAQARGHAAAAPAGTSAERPPPGLRICSLLPSSTEIVGTLGLAHSLVCVTHECNKAPDEKTLQHLLSSGAAIRVTASAIDPHVLSQRVIDDRVKGSMGDGSALYGIDNRAFAAARPTLVVTQGLCDVCAPSGGQVAEACAALQDDQTKGDAHPPRVLSLEPESLADVADTFAQVGVACGIPAAGAAMRASFIEGMRDIDAAVRVATGPLTSSSSASDGDAASPLASSGTAASSPVATSPSDSAAAAHGEAPRVFVLEWLDPPFDAGHWVPEIVEIAAGRLSGTQLAASAAAAAPSLTAGGPPEAAAAIAADEAARCKWSAFKSMEVTWECIAKADPDVLLVSCCGFGYARNVADARRTLRSHPVARELRAVRTGRVFAIDGDAYLARPGPSLLPGCATVAAATWYHDAGRMARLAATGHLPPEGSTWGRVDLSAAPDEAPEATPAHQDGAPGPASADAPGTPAERAPEGSGAAHSVSTAALVGDIEDRPTGVPSWAELHAEAVAKGDNFYTDPTSDLMVMTELVHKGRGRCCGSGCRHCPFSHERVRPEARAAKIAQPAWVVPPPRPQDAFWAGDGGTTVLFWSSGKDSFLALRALQQGWPAEVVPCCADAPAAADAPSGPAARIVLLTTFDAQSRMIAHQETSVDDAAAQAKALGVPLLGVPLHRGGPEYCSVIRGALGVVRRAAGGGALRLAFGDLHLAHVRQWREAASLGEPGDALAFPLWDVPYERLLRELVASGAVARVSAVTEAGRGVVTEGEIFDADVARRAREAGVDAFGENGEFHTLVDVSGVQAADASCVTPVRVCAV